MFVMSKRRRTGSGAVAVVGRAGKRPTDKQLICISKSGVDGTQVSSTLYTASFPGTVTGLRWNVSAAQDAGTGNALIFWAIVKVPQGTTAGTLSISDASTLYSPENMVMAFGGANCDPDGYGTLWDGATKGMRKLQAGDTLVWIAKGTATNTCNVKGCIQFFYKT